MSALAITIPTNDKEKEYIRKITKMSHFVLQAQSKQDAALHGTTKFFDYLIVSDSHGTGIKRHVLRDLITNLDWNTILQSKNWYKNDVDANGIYTSELFKALHNSLNAFSNIYSTKQGCTLSIILIYKNRFECYTIGDSTIKIWEHNEKSWNLKAKTVDHDIHFKQDVTCLEERKVENASFVRNNWRKHGVKIPGGVLRKNIWRLKPLNENTITMEPSAYFYFDDTSCLNMTRSLGHHPTESIIKLAKQYNHKLSLSEHSLTKLVIPREKNKKYIVIVATDGVWDVTAESKELEYVNMISNGANTETIVHEVKKCWNQEWNYIFKGELSRKTTIPVSNHDDIACAIAFID